MMTPEAHEVVEPQVRARVLEIDDMKCVASSVAYLNQPIPRLIVAVARDAFESIEALGVVATRASGDRRS